MSTGASARPRLSTGVDRARSPPCPFLLLTPRLPWPPREADFSLLPKHRQVLFGLTAPQTSPWGYGGTRCPAPRPCQMQALRAAPLSSPVKEGGRTVPGTGSWNRARRWSRVCAPGTSDTRGPPASHAELRAVQSCQARSRWEKAWPLLPPSPNPLEPRSLPGHGHC